MVIWPVSRFVQMLQLQDKGHKHFFRDAELRWQAHLMERLSFRQDTQSQAWSVIDLQARKAPAAIKSWRSSCLYTLHQNSTGYLATDTTPLMQLQTICFVKLVMYNVVQHVQKKAGCWNQCTEILSQKTPPKSSI